MATKKAKTAAPVRKKAVAKKAAPVRKKAVAKKAAPVRKKAVAKKATAPVKKAVAKKAVAKKAAPVKKALAKKAAPVRKKAVAKKTAPIRKKAIAKKAAPTSVKKIELAPVASVSSSEKGWIQQDPELPVFLKDVKTEIKKEPISTQGYSKKKSRKPVLVGFGSVVLLLGVALFTASSQTSTNLNSESQKSNEVSPSEVTSDEVTTEETVIEEEAPKPEVTESFSEQKPLKANLNSFAPRNFSSTSEGQEISFAWIAPADSSSVIGYELAVKKDGSSDWVVISSVTPQQMGISVELMSMESTSQYRIASLLESGKLAFNKAVLTHAGAVN
jgi:hypothetical protein